MTKDVRETLRTAARLASELAERLLANHDGIEASDWDELAALSAKVHGRVAGLAGDEGEYEVFAEAAPGADRVRGMRKTGAQDEEKAAARTLLIRRHYPAPMEGRPIDRCTECGFEWLGISDVGCPNCDSPNVERIYPEWDPSCGPARFETIQGLLDRLQADGNRICMNEDEPLIDELEALGRRSAVPDDPKEWCERYFGVEEAEERRRNAGDAGKIRPLEVPV